MTKNIVIAILLVVVILFLFTKPVYNKGSVTFIHDTVYQQKTFTHYKKGNDIYSYIIKTDSVQNYVHDTVTVYVTKTIQPKDRTAVYFGFLGDMRQDNRQLGVGVGIAIKTPKKGVITANATTNGYSLGYYLKF